MNSHLRILVMLLAACGLVACAQQPVQPSSDVPVEQGPAPVAARPSTPPSAAAEQKDSADGASQTKARTIVGDDQVIAPAKSVPVVTGEPLTFSFEDAPVADVVRAILGDILKQPYVLHPPLSGTVTLSSRNPIPPDQAVFLLESALQANGLLMVRDARGIYHVGRADALRNIGAAVRQVGNGGPLAPGYGAIVVPLRYIGANEMATILRPLAPAEAIVRVDTVRNLLVLVGTRSQAEGWLDLVHTFDVNLLKGMSVGLFPLKHASIKEVEAALRLVSGQPQPSVPGARASSAVSATAGAKSAASAPQGASEEAAMLGEANPLFGALRVMPIERLNAILVVTPRAAYLEEARRWIEKFDQPGNGGGEPSLHIYKVQNGNARHLASVLSGIFGAVQTTPPASVASSGVAPGLASGTATSFGRQQPLQPLGGTGGSNGLNAPLGGGAGGTGYGSFGSTARANQATGQGAAVTTLGGIRVMPDEQNNSILVWSTGAEFGKIESTLKRLDVPPTQVLIEASIIEVTLSDDLKYGLQWAFTDSHRHGAGAGLVGAIPGGASGGFSYTLRDSLGNMRVTLNALAEKSLIKVISSPSLMVLDNQVATIAVGTQQPIRTGETNYLGNINNSGTPITTTYQYKDTGVQLAVQPSVNSGDLVTMDITQSVTDVGDEDAVTGQRAFLQRQISSKVAVRSGEAIVLGGLIKDNATTGRSGVPLLSSIPIVGSLFGTTTTSSGRTELLVVITPRVVRTDPEIRQASEELRERLKGLKLLDLQGQQP